MDAQTESKVVHFDQNLHATEKSHAKNFLARQEKLLSDNDFPSVSAAIPVAKHPKVNMKTSLPNSWYESISIRICFGLKQVDKLFDSICPFLISYLKLLFFSNFGIQLSRFWWYLPRPTSSAGPPPGAPLRPRHDLRAAHLWDEPSQPGEATPER